MERLTPPRCPDDESLLSLLTGPVLGNIARVGRGKSEEPAVLSGGPATGRTTRRKRFPKVDFYGNETMTCGLAGHRHEWPELATVLCGRLHMGIDRRVYEARAGDWLALRPEVVHGECCLPSGLAYDLFWFVLQKEHLRVHATRYSPSGGYEVLCAAVMARPGTTLTSEVETLATRPWRPAAAARRRLVSLVSYAIEQLQSARQTPGAGVQTRAHARGMQWHPMVAEVRAMIELNARRPPSLVELATAVGLSPNYLSSLFHRQTGQTLHRFVDEHRIGLAQRLLAGETIAHVPLPPTPASGAAAGGRPSVKAVAYAMGFSDPYHFSKVFRRIAGMSPSAFRNRHLHAGHDDPPHERWGRGAKND